MTKLPDEPSPRWAEKQDKVAKTDQQVRVMYKVGGVVFIGIVIWTLVATFAGG